MLAPVCAAITTESISHFFRVAVLMAALKGPEQMVVYQESRHSVGNVPAANLGPFPPVLVADWLADRLAGKLSLANAVTSPVRGTSTRPPAEVPGEPIERHKRQIR